MALKTETRDVGGVMVTSTQFPAMKGYTLFTRLCKLAAPVISSLTAGLGGASDTAGALADLFAQLDEATAEDLALKLLASSQAQVGEKWLSLSSKTAIDAAFEGSLMAMLGAMKLAIEVNFSDFIANALSAARVKKAEAEAKAAALAALKESPKPSA